MSSCRISTSSISLNFACTRLQFRSEISVTLGNERGLEPVPTLETRVRSSYVFNQSVVCFLPKNKIVGKIFHIMYCRNYSEPDPDLEIRGVGGGLSLVRSLPHKSLAKVFSYVGDFVAASDRLLLAAPDIISSKTHNEVSFDLCWNLLGLTRMTRDGREDGKKVAVQNSEYNLVPDS